MNFFYKLLRSSYCYYYNNNRWRSAKSCSIQTPPNNNTPTPTTVGIAVDEITGKFVIASFAFTENTGEYFLLPPR